MKGSLLHLIVVIFFVQSCNLYKVPVEVQNIENGLYISFNGGLIPKYAIMTVEKETAKLETFTRWQGAWLPAIGAWDNSYQPQMLIVNEDGTLSNENVTIENKKHIKGIVENSFAGRIKFKFEKVDTLPKEYEEVKQKALQFTQRKQ